MSNPDKVNIEDNEKRLWILYVTCQSKDVCLSASRIEKYAIFPADPESVRVNEEVVDPSSLPVSLAGLYL